MRRYLQLGWVMALAPGVALAQAADKDEGGSSPAFWIAILAAGIGTFAMRASFLAFAHRLSEVPPSVQRVLRQIPPAALASLVIPAFLRPEGHLDLFQSRLVAGLRATLVAWRTKSVALTLVVGVGAVMLLDAL